MDGILFADLQYIKLKGIGWWPGQICFQVRKPTVKNKTHSSEVWDPACAHVYVFDNNSFVPVPHDQKDELLQSFSSPHDLKCALPKRYAIAYALAIAELWEQEDFRRSIEFVRRISNRENYKMFAGTQLDPDTRSFGKYS